MEEGKGNEDEQLREDEETQDEMVPQAMPPPIYGYYVDPAYMEHLQMYGYHPQYDYDYRYQYPLQQHMEGVPLPPGIPGLGGSTDPLEAVLGPFPCARLRNLDYSASTEDIIGLFQGLVVIDIVLVNQGEAYVVFSNPMDFQMALQRNGQSIGRTYISISAASRAEYYEAIASQHLKEQEQHTRPSRQSSQGMLDEGRGEDQPSSLGEQSRMSGLWGEPSGTTGTLQSLSGQPSYGEGLGARVPQSAIHGVPGRSVVGAGSSRGGLHAPLHKRTGGGIQIGDHTGFLRMRGLPFSATKEDIISFFVGYNPVPESVVLTYRNDGRATGEAYVGFSSPDDSKRAMELHRRTMGNRYIELFISNKDEQGRALARFGNR